MRVDPTGEFPWLALAIVVVCSVIGGIVGNAVANSAEQTRNDEINNSDRNENSDFSEGESEYVICTRSFNL